MFNTQDDPLGLAVSGRARERRINSRLHGLGPSIPVGPLADPMWDAAFQAIDEVGGGRRVRFEQDTQALPLVQDEAALNTGTPFYMRPMVPSNQLGTLSLKSLKRGR